MGVGKNTSSAENRYQAKGAMFRRVRVNTATSDTLERDQEISRTTLEDPQFRVLNPMYSGHVGIYD